MKKFVLLLGFMLLPATSLAILAQPQTAIIGRVTAINQDNSNYVKAGLDDVVPIRTYLPDPDEDGIIDTDRIPRIAKDYIGNFFDLPPDPPSANEYYEEFVSLEKAGDPQIQIGDIVIANHNNFIWILSEKGEMKQVYAKNQTSFRYADILFRPTFNNVTNCDLEGNDLYCPSNATFNISTSEQFSLMEDQQYAPDSTPFTKVQILRSKSLHESMVDRIMDAPPIVFHYVVTFAQVSESGVFPDVMKDHIYHDQIAFVKEKGIVQGNPDGTFAPDAPITRAAFAKMIIETQENPFILETCAQQAVISPFYDVALNVWYAPYVCAAKLLQFIEGYPDGSFQPARSISIAEASKILAIAFNVQLGEDQRQWFLPYYEGLQSVDAIPPTIRGYDQPITRGELAYMLQRLHNR